MLTTGTFLSGLIHVGLDELRGGARRRSAGENARRAAARTEAAGRPPEDRHAAAARRPHDRLLERSKVQPGDDPAPVFSFMGNARDASAAGPLLDHAHERAHARDHPRRPRSLAAVHRRHQGRRAALLSVDRGQGRALRRPEEPPDLPRARGPRDQRDLSERHLDVAAVRRAARARALDPGLRARAHPAARLLDRIRLFRSARAEVDARNQGDPRTLLRRPDQRHDGLRGSRGAGPARRHQRRALRARRRRLVRRAATKRISACWSTI